MNLSNLVFNAVKNVKYLEDSNFSYDGFIRGEFDNDMDYANSINNVFAPLNEAIHRLSDMNKISFKVERLPSPSSNGLVDIRSITYDIKTIVNIFVLSNGDYKKINHREFGRDKILLVDSFCVSGEYYIEYIQDIPNFSKDDIYYFEGTDSVIDQRDINLTDYGISDTMCSYIIEYCQGKLMEPIAPELANLHLTRAEQYFNDLDTRQTSFHQKQVTRKYRIE